MKVLLYGCDKTVRRAESSLVAKGDETVVLDSCRNVMDLKDKGSFSLAVVDMTAPGATLACEYLKRNWDVPVVVILGLVRKNGGCWTRSKWTATFTGRQARLSWWRV